MRKPDYYPPFINSRSAIISFDLNCFLRLPYVVVDGNKFL